MPKFIVISGKKGHGKNFFANLITPLIIEELDVSVAHTAFADPIKNFCNDVFGISLEDMNSQEGKLKPTHLKWKDIYGPIYVEAGFGKSADEYLTIREVLQIVGTDVWRNRFYPNIWAEAPFRKQWDTDIVIITDCRFPNEIAVAKQFNGIPVRVHRPCVINQDTHISETALDNYPFKQDEIVTNSCIADLIQYYELTLRPKLIYEN